MNGPIDKKDIRIVRTSTQIKIYSKTTHLLLLTVSRNLRLSDIYNVIDIHNCAYFNGTLDGQNTVTYPIPIVTDPIESPFYVGDKTTSPNIIFNENGWTTSK